MGITASEFRSTDPTDVASVYYADVYFHESSLILVVIRIKTECFVQVIQHNLLVGGSLCKVIMVRHR